MKMYTLTTYIRYYTEVSIRGYSARQRNKKIRKEEVKLLYLHMPLIIRKNEFRPVSKAIPQGMLSQLHVGALQLYKNTL